MTISSIPSVSTTFPRPLRLNHPFPNYLVVSTTPIATMTRQRNRISAPSSAASAFRDATSPSTGLRSSNNTFQGPRIKILEDTGEVKGLAYQLLSLPRVREVNECQTPQDLEAKVVEILGIDETETELKQAAKVDYFVAALHWAKEQGFTNMQLSGFHTLVHNCLQNLEDGIGMEENWRELKRCFVGVREASAEDVPGGPPALAIEPPSGMQTHQAPAATPGSAASAGVKDGSVTPGATPGVTPVRLDTPTSVAFVSGGIEFFDVKQAEAIVGYITVTLFQHYRLYEFAFHRRQEESSIRRSLKVSIPPDAGLPYPNPLAEAVEKEIFVSLLQPQPETPQVESRASSDRAASLPADLVAARLVDDVKSLVETTTKEVFGEVESDVAFRLKERENQYINKINKIHRISPSQTPGS